MANRTLKLLTLTALLIFCGNAAAQNISQKASVPSQLTYSEYDDNILYIPLTTLNLISGTAKNRNIPSQNTMNTAIVLYHYMIPIYH